MDALPFPSKDIDGDEDEDGGASLGVLVGVCDGEVREEVVAQSEREGESV